jgi:hypothetical protein
VGNPVPYDANRLLEGVNVLKITMRNPYLTGMRIDVLDFVSPFRNLVRARLLAPPYFIFQRFDFPIPNYEPVFYPRLCHARQRLQQA